VRFLFNVVKDDATPFSKRVQKGIANQSQLNKAASASMLPLVQRNLRAMSGMNHNLFGAPSTFWNLMLSGTYAGEDSDGGFVSMPRPVALRRFGGTIFPGEGKKRLAIPANAQAYGQSPRSFSDLRLVVFGGRGGKTMALVQNQQQHIGYRHMKNGTIKVTHGAVKGGDVFFWLVESATIKADENVLPTDEELVGAVKQGVGDYITRLARRNS